MISQEFSGVGVPPKVAQLLEANNLKFIKEFKGGHTGATVYSVEDNSKKKSWFLKLLKKVIQLLVLK